MQVSIDVILAIAGVVSMLAGMVTFFYKMLSRFDRIEQTSAKQQHELEQRRTDNSIMLRSISACLDGLKQIGANGNVTSVKKELDEYIFQQRE
jgi:flagellar basal body-associated protein FliL